MMDGSGYDAIEKNSEMLAPLSTLAVHAEMPEPTVIQA